MKNKCAQQAMFHKRQLSQKHVVKDISNLEECSPHGCRVIADIMLNKTAWLTDTILDAAQSVLKSMTPADGF